LTRREICVIGVPTNSAGKPNGVAGAPAALRRAGILNALRKGNEVHDDGDVSFHRPTTSKRDSRSGIVGHGSLVSMIRSVRARVSHALQQNEFPVVIGGDCPILLGCLAGSVQTFGPIGLFFLDGHEDAYLPHQSPTGEAADMELGFALGVGVPPLIQKAIGDSLLSPNLVCMLGPRDKQILQNANVKSLADGSITYYDDVTLRRADIAVLTRRLTRQLASKVSTLWLHIDLDVLSTRSLPAVDYQQPGGLNWSQLEKVTKTILTSGNVVGLNLTINNPDLDPDRRFASRIVRYMQNVLG
jgi:arginase